jgi:hypothetical protein
MDAVAQRACGVQVSRSAAGGILWHSDDISVILSSRPFAFRACSSNFHKTAWEDFKCLVYEFVTFAHVGA